MRLLDAGCGPGSITVGLARAVAPGPAVGIDVLDAVVEDARDRAASSGVDNLRFERGDVYALGYEPRSFDVVYAHQVLQHLSRPVDALREMKRVLDDGGLVAVRDADYATMTWWPESAGIARWLEVYHAVARRNGAEADAGRRLASWVRAAGFEELTASADAVVQATREEVENWGFSWAERALHSSFAEQAVAYGLATRAGLEEMAAAFRAWAAEPDAFWMYTNVEVIGRKGR